MSYPETLTSFVDRRDTVANVPPSAERRQFVNSYDQLSLPGQELARAIDEYKVRHRRRFITYDEVLAVVQSLGYHK
jgi:hypothetical protein